MMDKLRAVCESALVSGVLVNSDNIFELSRLALNFSCFSKPSNNILEKCARFLRKEISRDFGVLKRFGREDYDIFQVKSLGTSLIYRKSRKNKFNIGVGMTSAVQSFQTFSYKENVLSVKMRGYRIPPHLFPRTPF